MDWEEWCQEYPARNVKIIHPEEIESGPFDFQMEAANAEEELEIQNEYGGYEIVSYLGKFYVIKRPKENPIHGN